MLEELAEHNSLFVTFKLDVEAKKNLSLLIRLGYYADVLVAVNATIKRLAAEVSHTPTDGRRPKY